mmetsp:Transcript_99148/g.305635  ORF Transcript_99148/g.305635 Transcript_99148/m.305635 type:complete len:214 (+) Transcript_99148:254-895(+)
MPRSAARRAAPRPDGTRRGSKRGGTAAVRADRPPEEAAGHSAAKGRAAPRPPVGRGGLRRCRRDMGGGGGTARPAAAGPVERQPRGRRLLPSRPGGSRRPCPTAAKAPLRDRPRQLWQRLRLAGALRRLQFRALAPPPPLPRPPPRDASQGLGTPHLKHSSLRAKLLVPHLSHSQSPPQFPLGRPPGPTSRRRSSRPPLRERSRPPPPRPRSS